MSSANTSSMNTSEPNLVLTGFMGTGKTTVAKMLAPLLNFEFVDTDDIIEQRHGPIPTIFAERGEPAFRALERDLAAELSARHGLVVATGGAMLTDEVNAASLARTGDVVCLTASLHEILRRVTADGASDRPLLAGPHPAQTIRDLLHSRAQAYARFPQLHTDGVDPNVLAKEILGLRSLATAPRTMTSGVSTARGTTIIGVGVLPHFDRWASLPGPFVVKGDQASIERYSLFFESNGEPTRSTAGESADRAGSPVVTLGRVELTTDAVPASLACPTDLGAMTTPGRAATTIIDVAVLQTVEPTELAEGFEELNWDLDPDLTNATSLEALVDRIHDHLAGAALTGE